MQGLSSSQNLRIVICPVASTMWESGGTPPGLCLVPGGKLDAGLANPSTSAFSLGFFCPIPSIRVATPHKLTQERESSVSVHPFIVPDLPRYVLGLKGPRSLQFLNHQDQRFCLMGWQVAGSLPRRKSEKARRRGSERVHEQAFLRMCSALRFN